MSQPSSKKIELYLRSKLSEKCTDLEIVTMTTDLCKILEIATSATTKKSDTKGYTREQCELWIKNPKKNPVSGRAIEEGKSTWNELEKTAKKFGLEIGKPLPAVKHDESEDDASSENSDEEVVKKTPSKKEPKASKTNKKSKLKEAIDPKSEVASNVEKQKDTAVIQQNSFGNWEHFGTGLVWDKTLGLVNGKQLSNGSIGPLSENDIQLCILNKWKYKQVELQQTTKSNVEVYDDDDYEPNEDLDDLYN